MTVASGASVRGGRASGSSTRVGAGGASPWPTRVRQRRPGRSRLSLVAHVVLGRRRGQRWPHSSRVAGATRLARGGYGRDTRKSIQADANTNPATHEDPWALEERGQKDCRANISAGWYRPGGRRCFSSCAVSVSRLSLARPCIGNASSSKPKVHLGSRTRSRLKRGQPRASSTGRKGARPQRLRC